MLDVAMGEAFTAEDVLAEREVSQMTPEDLATLREFNLRTHVEATAIEDLAPMENGTIETLESVVGPKVAGEVLDFAGVVDGGGIKMSMFANFKEKPPLSLVPRALLYACGRALGFGANKYAANNWRRGMKWSSPLSGLLRHLTAWGEGEDFDEESGLSHLDHAAACLAFLTHMESDDRYEHLDDRP
jgi:hypothetical protein